MLKTVICDLFGIRYPIIQGGMTHLATAELVSAVSNNGGLGVIAAGHYDSKWLRQQIVHTRRLTDNPFGINLYLQSPFLKDQIQVILEENVDIVITGGGNPEKIVADLLNKGIKTLVVVGDLKSAIQAEQSGVQAIIAEGMEAGGHIGKISTKTLLKQIVSVVKIPVIAAGGISDGKGLSEIIKLGAQGAQMGTRFICSEECPAHRNFKNAIVASGSKGTTVLGLLRGPRIRCLANKFTSQYQALEEAGATASELHMFSYGRFYKGVIEGDLEQGCLMAGKSANKINDIKSVKQIIQEIVAGAENALNIA